MTGLKEYIDKDDNSSLPSIDSRDTDAPKPKVRKFSGDLFNDRDESQIAVKAFLTQKWWNMKLSKRSMFKRREVFPLFGMLVTNLGLCQPSSAPSERVFSILEHNFDDTQTVAREDLKETTCKLIYNNRRS